jgi:N-methylhydantoinase A
MIAPSAYRMSIDVGGTFTDVVLLDDRSGSVRFAKVLSTPDDPSVGSLAGAAELLRREAVAPASVGEVVHATTVATNAVIERRGARIGLITTRGFRDTLEIGRECRYDIYDLGLRLPEPLVPRPRRAEVDERLTWTGDVLRPLDEAGARATLTALVRRHGIEALAIALLHSYANPAHELGLAALARELFPDLDVSVSSLVAGEVREFERTSTVVVDAYVKPMVRRYVQGLSDGLKALGLPRAVSMMLSHGGIGAATQVAESFPVRMIESGPAAGAIAAAFVARQALDPPHAVAFDMGGTTAKLSLVRGGAPTITHEYEVAHVHRFKRGSGHPLQVSAIELLEIGAGGGSIARISDLGLLTVGPESAGAAPGPACYGFGGTRPTVTDADVVLGYLDPRYFLGGDMTLDMDASRRAIDEHLAHPLRMSVEAAAWGVHDVVNERMAAATRAHAAEKGVDLRQWSLIAFGGAGPVHAYALAKKLGLGRVVCPFGAGVASAIGCLVADPAIDLVAAFGARLDACEWSAVASRFEEMRQSGTTMLAGLIGPTARVALHGAMDMRCEGQGFSVTVAMPQDVPVGPSLVPALEAGFAERYEELYGHCPPRVALEIVTLRARVEHRRSETAVRAPDGGAGSVSALKGTRRAYVDAASGFADASVYDRYRLAAGARGRGPALIEERETTTVVGPDASFRIDASGHLIVEIDRH